MTEINLVGLSASEAVPGNYITVNFAAGDASGATETYKALLLGNMLSTGSATVDGYVYGPDTDVQLATEQDAINLFGRGSELHLMYKDFVKKNKSTPVYAVAVTESAGSQATGTITITSAAGATAAATLRVKIEDKQVDCGIAVDDSANTIATNLSAAINSLLDLAVTATPSSNTVVMTARQKGLRGNFIRYSAQVIPSSDCGVTVSPTLRTNFTGGTTADSNTTALTTISNSRYYYIVSAAEDATQVGALKTHVDNMAGAITGMRQRVVAGSVDTLANITTVATGVNHPRVEFVWLNQCDVVPSRMAARAAAEYMLAETALGAVGTLNFNGKVVDMLAPLSGAKPTHTQLGSAITNGITPLKVNSNNTVSITKRVTSKSLDGSYQDDRIRAAHKVTVCDVFADQLQARVALRFAGMTIGDDPSENEPSPPASVVTPRMFRAVAEELVDEFFAAGLVQNPTTIKDNMIVVRETTPSTRISCSIPMETIDVLDITATVVNQTH